MSTQITMEEFEEKYEPYLNKYYICSVQIIPSLMELGARYIEAIREIHRKHNLFIKHTCSCTESGNTRWNFVYLRSEIVGKEVEQLLIDAWNNEFAPMGHKADRGLGIFTRSGKACTCPFSVK